MTVTIAPFVVQSWETETPTPKAQDGYSWNTSGNHLAKMLQEANYPEEVQHHFLSYYRANICPLLGARPDSNSSKSGVGWDGNPLEYSFELKGSTKSRSVRFVVNLSELRPVDKNNTLSMANTQKVVDALAEKTPGFDDTWYRVLKERLVYSHLSASEQQDLIAKAGQQTSVIVGFDIYPRITDSERLPVMGKVYFPPLLRGRGQGHYPVASRPLRPSATPQYRRISEHSPVGQCHQ